MSRIYPLIVRNISYDDAIFNESEYIFVCGNNGPKASKNKKITARTVDGIKVEYKKVNNVLIILKEHLIRIYKKGDY
jgi:hypothetical protein